MAFLGVVPNLFAQTPSVQAKAEMAFRKQLNASNQRFMQNKGQWDKKAKFLAQYPGYAVWLTEKGGWRVDQFRKSTDEKRVGQVVDFALVGGAAKPQHVPSKASQARTDFLNRKKIVRGVRRYGEVLVEDVYAGTDMRWYVEKGAPRFDFILAPGANPEKVQIQVRGGKSLSVGQDGDLKVATEHGEIRYADLQAYQTIAGKRAKVDVSFKLLGKHRFGFEVGGYDRSRELVIDPLVYGSHYGGNSVGLFESGLDEVRAVTADADFGVFVTGWTQSPAFPAIYGPYSININGFQDAFFSKFQGDAYSHDYAAYIGGSGDELGMHVAMDPSGNHIWMAGETDSADFPGITGSSFQQAMAGSSDIFLIRFTKDATNVVVPDYVTFYGSAGEESLGGLAVGPLSGDVIITGSTDGGLPIKNNSYLGGASDAFMARFTTSAGGGITGMKHCFYVGGTSADTGAGVIADMDDNAILCGTISFSGNIDTSLDPSVYDTTPGVYFNGRLLRNSDIFVRKYDADGNLLVSALLGGNGHDSSAGLAVDLTGNIYLTGIARSFNFPRTPGVYGENFTNNAVVFATKINADASAIVYSSHLRTQNTVTPRGIAVDSRGTAWVAGTVGFSLGFPFPPANPNQPNSVTFGSVPTTPDALDPLYESPNVPELPTTEGFILALSPTATSLLYGSYIGAILDEQVYAPFVDRFGDAWAVGYTESSRYYERVSTTGAVTAYNRPGTISLPAALISPFAFKTVSDQSLFPTTVSKPYGILGGAAPAFINADVRADGFMIKHRLNFPAISNLTLNPVDVAGGLGATSVGTVTLTGPAPAGGLDVLVTLNNSAASFSSSGPQNSLILNFPTGTTTNTFTLYTSPVTDPTQVQVRADLEGSFLIRVLTVQPWLQQLTVTPSTIVGGNVVTGRITLWQPAINDITVDLSTDASGLVSFPGGSVVTIPAGVLTAPFTIQTRGVGVATDVPVTATLLGVGKTSFVRLLPANLISVTFNPGRVTAGSSATGTITLDGEAGPAFTVDLTLGPGTPGYTLTPSSVTFNPGDRTKTFTIQTAYETANTQRTVTASRTGQAPYTDQSVAGTLFVDAAALLSFTVAPTTIDPGGSATGTVSINVAAATGGANVDITTNNSLITVNSPVTIPSGASSVNFPINAANVAVASDTVVDVTATRGPISITRQVTVRATAATLDISPSSVLGGTSATGTVTVANPAGVGGLTMTLTSDQGAAIVPASVTILQGQSSATFTVNTTAVGADVVATITASVGTISVSDTLVIRAVSLIGLQFVPSRVRGGFQTTNMTITLDANAPVGGAVVSLSSSNPSIANIPSSVTVLAGTSSRTVTVTTNRVSRTLATQVVGTYGDDIVVAVLTVTR
jgi:hypothetical protein